MAHKREEDVKSDVTLSYCVSQTQARLHYALEALLVDGSPTFLHEEKHSHVFWRRSCNRAVCVILYRTSKASFSCWKLSPDRSSNLLERGRQKNKLSLCDASGRNRAL